MSEELQRIPFVFDEAARAFIISTLKEFIPEDVKSRNESASLSLICPFFIPATIAFSGGRRAT